MSTANWPPTARQLRYLRQLANRAGQTFTTPRTRTQASWEIERLQAVTNTGMTFAELAEERRVRLDTADASLEIPSSLRDELDRFNATRVHPTEVAGYGASATWSRGA